MKKQRIAQNNKDFFVQNDGGKNVTNVLPYVRGEFTNRNRR